MKPYQPQAQLVKIWMPHHQPAQLKAQPSHSNYIHHLQKEQEEM